MQKNKALLSIIISAFAVGTTQPAHFNWLTSSSLYKKGTDICSHLSYNDTYKTVAHYGSWLLKKANKHKCVISLAVAAIMIYVKTRWHKDRLCKLTPQERQQKESYYSELYSELDYLEGSPQMKAM